MLENMLLKSMADTDALHCNPSLARSMEHHVAVRYSCTSAVYSGNKQKHIVASCCLEGKLDAAMTYSSGVSVTLQYRSNYTLIVSHYHQRMQTASMN